MVLEPAAWTLSVDALNGRMDPEHYLPATLSLEEGIRASAGRLLSDLAHLRMETPRLRADAVIDYVDIASVDRRTGALHPESMTWSDAPSRARRYARPGDLVVSLVRPSRNVVGVVPRDSQDLVVSNGFAVLKPLGIGTWGLFAFLKSEQFVAQAVRRCTASMYPTIADSDLMTIWVPTVDLERAGDAAQEAHELHRAASKMMASALEDAAAALRESVEIPDV